MSSAHIKIIQIFSPPFASAKRRVICFPPFVTTTVGLTLYWQTLSSNLKNIFEERQKARLDGMAATSYGAAACRKKGAVNTLSEINF